MSKKYLVKFSFSSDSTMVPVGLVRPNLTGDARIELYKVADEAWVRKTFHKDIDLDGMELNDKWEIQLFGDKDE
jgi:hypothetical protein